MEDPRKEVLLRIYYRFHDLFHYAKGSSHNHQAWEGGFADHIAESIRINNATYPALESIRPLPFSKDSAAICLFLHDIEKPFRYGPEGHLDCQVYRDRGSHEHGPDATGAPLGRGPHRGRLPDLRPSRWNLVPPHTPGTRSAYPGLQDLSEVPIPLWVCLAMGLVIHSNHNPALSGGRHDSQ